MLPRLLFTLWLFSPLVALAQPLTVYVTVAPLAWLAERVGGDQVAVHSLVRPGQDPHGFEPSPRQLGHLQGADAYLSLDLPFERAWLPRAAAQNPQLRIVPLVEGETEHEVRADTHARHHHHEEADPHVWTDPREMVVLSERMQALFSELRPARAAVFAARQAAVRDELLALDADLAAGFATMSSKAFLVHHPAWGHLAERYGLTQLAIEQDGKEPGPRALAALSAQVRHHGLKVLFVESQASDHLAQGLADTLGLKVVPLDPLAADYLVNMQRVGRLIREGQQ